MNELVEEIKMLYEYFNGGDYLFFTIFILSVIYIFSVEENKKIKDFFVYFSVFILIIIWNPICIYFLNKMINIGAMYRIYYMLPSYLTIAYAGTKIIENCKNNFTKSISLAGMIIVIVSNGGPIFSVHTTSHVYNNYKLPDETVNIAYMIAEDTKTEYKKAIVPYDGMSSQIRQIAPQIELCYSRIVSNLKDENGNELPQDTEDASTYPPVVNLNAGNVEYVANLCEETNTNYVVFHKSTVLSDKMENYGFELFDETISYLIYRKK